MIDLVRWRTSDWDICMGFSWIAMTFVWPMTGPFLSFVSFSLLVCVLLVLVRLASSSEGGSCRGDQQSHK